MNKKIITLTITICLILTACMGGGSYGTGLTGYDSGKQRLNVLSYSLEGILLNRKGRPIPNVTITINTSQGTLYTSTDSQGKFTEAIETLSGWPLSFTFTKDLIQANCSSNISPAGEDTVKATFTLRGERRIECP